MYPPPLVRGAQCDMMDSGASSRLAAVWFYSGGAVDDQYGGACASRVGVCGLSLSPLCEPAQSSESSDDGERSENSVRGYSVKIHNVLWHRHMRVDS